VNYIEKFTDDELTTIIEAGLIYMCACPAQVAESIRHTRGLYRYQVNCLLDSNNDSSVHTTIAQTTIEVHAKLEECMERVLEIEKWDRTTLKMPDGLRKRQSVEINKEI
jgi:hypothetical protein